MPATSSIGGEYLASPNKVVRAANAIDYTYRESVKGRRRLCCYSTSAEIWTTGIPR